MSINSLSHFQAFYQVHAFEIKAKTEDITFQTVPFSLNYLRLENQSFSSVFFDSFIHD